MSIRKEQPFQDLRITGIDTARSHAIDGGMARIYFQLSAPPPFGWSYIFTTVWQAVEYPMKSHAGVESDSVWINCRPEDFEPHHLEQLENAVAQTNANYRDKTQAQAINTIRQRELQLQLQSKLEDIGQTFYPDQRPESSPTPSKSRFNNFFAGWVRLLFPGRKP